MISANNVTLRVGKKALFEDVNIKFTEGNCYGLIGANGAGKSTFLKILSGNLEPTSGDIVITPGQRLSFLQQDHFKYDQFPVLDTVIMGNQRLYDIMKEKDAIYMKEDFTDEDGIKAAELEGEFASMNGWEAESDAENLLNGLGVDTEFHYKQMSELTGALKVKVLLAQALFGNPDILLLDEPTNHLDLDSREWIEEAVEEFSGTLLFVSHDRYFIDRFANRIWTLEGGKIQDFRGDYTAYQAYRERQKALTPSPKKEEKAKKEKPKRSGGTKQLKKELAAAEKRMEKLDQLLEALNVQKEAAASDYQKLQELLQQEAAYNAEYDALMETWETLSEAIAAEEGT